MFKYCNQLARPIGMQGSDSNWGAQTFGVLIAQGALSHVRKLDSALRASIHKPIAAHGVKFGSRDDFGELFHVGRLDINNVKTLILNIEVPKIDPQIITADKGLSVAVH